MIMLCLVTQLCPTLCDPRLLCPWDFSGKNTGVGCRFLPQGIIPTQRSNTRLFVSSVGRHIHQ